ncbi:SHOCT domain-containing protein [Spirosoma sp. KNUC1025]|uniref:SHOCT domain-containing protein n=1 Tax=Spirosoma sp. KNUC1025 TaxID=2894082 RepID=UPI003862F15E|nr:SHOCT domain-containing protein [Spirosoma sp. KNUC1025]
MKHLFLIAYLVSLTQSVQAQRRPITRDDLNNSQQPVEYFVAGYQTSVDGWVIKTGDTLQLGRGSMFDKAFAFIYVNPQSFFSANDYNGRKVKEYLPSLYADKRVVIKDIKSIGTKRSGYTAVIIGSVGGIKRYMIEIDNAIEAGELLPPVEFRQAYSQPSQPPSFSVADELIKLKKLMDEGVLSKDEFEAQKKKLLNQ